MHTQQRPANTQSNQNWAQQEGEETKESGKSNYRKNLSIKMCTSGVCASEIGLIGENPIHQPQPSSTFVQ